jgi:hypothetical protein
MGHGRHHGGMGGQGCCLPGGGLRGHGWCCGGGGMMFGPCGGFGFRRFISPAEELEGLKEYLEELKKETAGVEARIHELKGQK